MSKWGDSWKPTWLYGCTNWLLFVAGSINLGVGTWAGLNGGVAVTATCLAAGLILLFAATVDRFESVKGLGVEAKTRRLDKKIEQADEALTRLQELAELTGSALVDLNSRVGRWSMPLIGKDAYEVTQRVRRILVALGSDESVIRRTLEPQIRTFCLDLCRALLKPVEHALQDRIDELTERRDSMGRRVDPGNPEYRELCNQIEIGLAYADGKLKALEEMSIATRPDQLLHLIEDTPLVDPQVLSAARARSEPLVASMQEFRKNLEISDPKPCFDAINEFLFLRRADPAF